MTWHFLNVVFSVQLCHLNPCIELWEVPDPQLACFLLIKLENKMIQDVHENANPECDHSEYVPTNEEEHTSSIATWEQRENTSVGRGSTPYTTRHCIFNSLCGIIFVNACGIIL